MTHEALHELGASVLDLVSCSSPHHSAIHSAPEAPRPPGCFLSRPGASSQEPRTVLLLPYILPHPLQLSSLASFKSLLQFTLSVNSILMGLCYLVTANPSPNNPVANLCYHVAGKIDCILKSIKTVIT